MLHPNSRLQSAWNFAQLGLLIFPLVPSIGAVGIFLAIVVTWRFKYRQIISHHLNWGLGILSIWLAVASYFAFDRTSAFLGLFNFLPFFIFFTAFSTLIQTPAQLRQIAKIIVITALAVVILGFGQLVFSWATPVQLQPLLGWQLVANGNPPGRMAAVFMYANILAGYLVIAFILALGLWIEDYQKRTPRSRGFFFNSARNYLLLIAVIGIFIALILTNSRNAWISAFVASLGFAIYQGWRWLVAGVCAIASTILLAAFAPSPINKLLRTVVPTFFWARLTDQLYPNRPIPLLRTTQWQFAWSLTQQRPLTGWGLRNFTSLYQNQMHVWLGHPHNFFLMLSAETGIAAIFFCGWVGWILFQSMKILRNWQFKATTSHRQAADKIIFFSYLMAFFTCILFNLVDVTIFDLRLNTFGWLLLSAIAGVVAQSHQQHAHLPK